MQAVIENLRDELVVIFALHIIIFLFLDRAQLKSRRKILLGAEKHPLLIWLGPGCWASYYTYMPIYLLLIFSRYLFLHPTRHHHTDSLAPIWQWFVVAAIIVGFAGLTVNGVRFQLRVRALRCFVVSRGKLKARFDKLSERSKLFVFPPLSLFVLPDNSFSEQCSLFGLGVAVPRSFLDSLTRSEVDSLAARQLSLQSTRFYFPAFWFFLAANAAVVIPVFWLHPSSLIADAIYALLLVAELFVLSRMLPGMLLQADLRAARLVDDAESFISALGALSRFNGTQPDETLLAAISKEWSITPDRIQALLIEHETREEDRYPTTGSYMDTGL